MGRLEWETSQVSGRVQGAMLAGGCESGDDRDGVVLCLRSRHLPLGYQMKILQGRKEEMKVRRGRMVGVVR